MRRITLSTFFCLIALVALSSQKSYAQSDSRSSQSDQLQLLKELLNEMRQLRAELSRMNSNAYRAQLLVERMKLQQDQVNRLAAELNQVNSEVGELQSSRPGLNGKIEDLEKQFRNGLIAPSDVKSAKDALERLGQREQRLHERDSQLSAELNTARVNLEALKARLNEIELEMLLKK
jgi:uncharacterized coiled-coil DUF342 family protein